MNLKVNWMLDAVLRLAVVLAVYVGVVTVQGCWRKWRDADDLFYDGYLWDCLQCNEKYQKECSMEVAAGCMCEGLWLPEDIYCFDESMEWYVIFIHEGWEKGWEKPNDPELNEDDYIRICFLHTFHT